MHSVDTDGETETFALWELNAFNAHVAFISSLKWASIYY